jgi:thiol:disulfide interchange protein
MTPLDTASTPETPRTVARAGSRRSTRAAPAASILAALLVLVVAAWSGASELSGDFDGKGWLQGADGLFNAIESLKADQPAPMVVYFYTDWCGYCRQFERELLGTAPVRKYFGDVLAVRINPEAGPRERQIAEYYGVSGFPSFFVHSGRSNTLSRVERMRVENGQPRIMTPAEFIDAVRTAGTR